MKIDKTYFTVTEIRERWHLSEADVAYLAENGDLRLSVRVFEVPVEIGEISESPDGNWCKVPHARMRYSGLLDLHAADAFQAFEANQVTLKSFVPPEGGYASVIEDHPGVLVRSCRFLIRREERDRLEERTGFAERHAGLVVSHRYREVQLNGEIFHFGPIQAEVIRVLHGAYLAGEPWQSGKAILTAAGSKSMKMIDVFKSQPNWRRLIVSDHRGCYRLAVEPGGVPSRPPRRGMGAGRERD